MFLPLKLNNNHKNNSEQTLSENMDSTKISFRNVTLITHYNYIKNHLHKIKIYLWTEQFLILHVKKYNFKINRYIF